MRLRIRCK